MILCSAAGALAEPGLAKPLPKQVEFADWELGAFIHYTLNPFIDQEHGDGQEPPSKFNPTELDVEQWVLTAKSMGARYAVLTARHEGGFCLWPSKTTDYTIAGSPYQDGKGDLVRDFAAACRKHGLKVGLYHTAAFNAHEALKGFDLENYLKNNQPRHVWSPAWGAMGAAFRADPTKRERFDKIQVEQFRELLTNYGPIDFMWSDHWNAGDPEGLWRKVTDLAEELQPNMVMMGPDTWVPGNETGHVVYPMWNAVNTQDGTVYTRPVSDYTTGNDYGLLEGGATRGNPFGKHWRVRECTTHSAFHHGGWFWHPDDVKRTYPRRHWEHVDLYYRTVGLGANTIINLPPDTRGLIPDDIAAAAKELGDAIRERFSTPIAERDDVTVGETVELRWDELQKINTVVTMENIANGQRIAKYVLEAWVDGGWQTLEPRNKLTAWKPYESNPGYETIGHKKIDRVAPVTTDRIRIRCLESVAGTPEIRSLAVYNCPPIERTFKSAYPWLSGVDTLFESAHNGVRRDADYKGNPIEIGGKSFERGLLVCPVAATRIGVAEYDLATVPKATGMTATVGIEDATDGKGSSEFVVEAFVKDRWETLIKSPRLTGKDAGVAIEVSFPAGATKIRLKTTHGGDGTSSDHAMWADARFVEGR